MPEQKPRPWQHDFITCLGSGELGREGFDMRLSCQCNTMHRRDVVCGGGAALFSTIIATLTGSSKPVKAEAISGSVPELDGVAGRVVVDSYQFAVAPSRKLADVDIQHFGWGGRGGKPPGRRAGSAVRLC